MGGPGSGKGTQAQLLKDQFHLAHVSTGQLLRDAAEGKSTMTSTLPSATGFFGMSMRSDIIVGETEAKRSHIASMMDEGQLVPDEILGTPDLIILLQCPDDNVLAQRMADRNRSDDNPSSVAERLRQYRRDAPHIRQLFEELVEAGSTALAANPNLTSTPRMVKLDAAQSIETIAETLRLEMESLFGASTETKPSETKLPHLHNIQLPSRHLIDAVASAPSVSSNQTQIQQQQQTHITNMPPPPAATRSWFRWW
eukprot:jgi/Hompol1/3000/HPOL_003076-RA